MSKEFLSLQSIASSWNCGGIRGVFGQPNWLNDNFFSIISHLLRTPIVNMKMALTLRMPMTEQGQN
ncbi:hypothetical protein H6F87_06120 [Cyanobacteria bacterium FACHB-502]|nr:hypothetical protein [Cyanobacteria bacterium FACHB-502]